MIKIKYRNLWNFFKYLKNYYKEIIFMFIGIGLNQVCSLALPKFMSRLIDIGIRRNGIENIDLARNINLSQQEILSIQTSYILKIGLYMLVITLFSILISIYVNRLKVRISSGISSELRKDLFHKVINLPYSCACKFSDSSLITRLTNDVEHVQALVLMSTQIIVPPILMIGGIVMAINTSPSMLWMMLLESVLAGGLICLGFKIITPYLKLLQKLGDKFNLLVKEQLTGLITIRGFGNKKFEENRFEKSNCKFTNIFLFVSKIRSFLPPILTVSMNLLTALIIWIGANKINERTMELGEVIAFMQYSLMVIGAFVMFSFMISSVPKSMVSVDRIAEILYVQENDKNKENLKKLENNFSGKIEFKNVNFKYENAVESVLEDVSFTFDTETILGIVGNTGSGKSTLLKLILGLFDLKSGTIKFGDYNLNDLDKSSIINSISYASQKDSLFSGTISSNLRMSNPEASDELLLKALKIVQLEDFVNQKGLDYKILQSGANVSGGQKQRLCLARALIKKSRIYILDDIFSGLDFKTEYNIRKDLFHFLKGSQVILVSQRIGSVKSADKIIVLNEGKIVGNGSHEELIKSCEVYKKMFKLQLGSEI